MKLLFITFLSFVTFFGFSQKKTVTENSFKIIQYKPTKKIGSQLRLKRVFDDSRCPENTQCIWAGEVSAEILIYKNKKLIEEKIIIFNSQNYEQNLKWFSSFYSIKVKSVEVQPNLKEGVLVEPSDYFLKVVY